MNQDIFDRENLARKDTILSSLTLTTPVDASGNIATSIAAAPIPPNFPLLVPGLLGLVGLRRKSIFNS